MFSSLTINIDLEDCLANNFYRSTSDAKNGDIGTVV